MNKKAESEAMLLALHDDLAEQLAGISLLLSAAAVRLKRERHPIADQLQTASKHLDTSLAHIRYLALRPDPETRHH